MAKAVKIYTTGGPEVLKYEDHDPGHPGPGEALIRQDAVGLNFIDIYHRTGLYPLTGFPAIPGLEGAGVVEEIGEGVTEVRAGDRIAYAGLPLGAYAQVRLIPSHRLVRLPDKITMQQAAGMMLKGMTARYLLHGCYPLKAGDTILIHAAAGGVGSIVCQWANHIGATVIGTVGSEEKAQTVQALGCHHPILYNKQNFVDEVRRITGGGGVDVVYDSVGEATFMQSMDCIRPMGTMVSFGQSSGAVSPINTGLLAAKGSLFLTRPSLMTYTEKRDALVDHAEDLFSVVEGGQVRINVNRTYPLADVVKAHMDLEGRKTQGSTVLLP
ncbi:MAG: quinone oxidoreductase [Desulfobacteraceae bacterium]|nr:quinone oxidoreductase [Desulfobacteraceae bacterium]